MKIRVNQHDEVCATIKSTCVGKLCRTKTLAVQFMDCGGEPNSVQLAFAERLASGAVDCSELVIQSAMAYWNTAIKRDPSWFEGFKPLKTKEELLKKLTIEVAYIHYCGAGVDDVKCGFGGSWALDDEHGFGILIHHGKVLEIGGQEVGFRDDDAPEIENEFTLNSGIRSIKRLIAFHLSECKGWSGGSEGILRDMAKAAGKPDPILKMNEELAILRNRLAEFEEKLKSLRDHNRRPL